MFLWVFSLYTKFCVSTLKSRFEKTLAAEIQDSHEIEE